MVSLSPKLRFPAAHSGYSTEFLHDLFIALGIQVTCSGLGNWNAHSRGDCYLVDT